MTHRDGIARGAGRWFAATLCGSLLTLTLLTFLAERVRSAEATFAVLPVNGEGALCEDGFVASGVRFVPVSFVVGHREIAGAPLVSIADASLAELEGGTELDWHSSEVPVASSDAAGRLAFQWSQRFRDRYVCGDRIASWQQDSRVFVLRAPGCLERVLVLSREFQLPEIELVCPGRSAAGRSISL